jgi:hypothetical protein
MNTFTEGWSHDGRTRTVEGRASSRRRRALDRHTEGGHQQGGRMGLFAILVLSGAIDPNVSLAELLEAWLRVESSPAGRDGLRAQAPEDIALEVVSRNTFLLS